MPAPLCSKGRSCKAAPAAAAQDLLRGVQPMVADERYHLRLSTVTQVKDALRSGYGCGSGWVWPGSVASEFGVCSEMTLIHDVTAYIADSWFHYQLAAKTITSAISTIYLVGNKFQITGVSKAELSRDGQYFYHFIRKHSNASGNMLDDSECKGSREWTNSRRPWPYITCVLCFVSQYEWCTDMYSNNTMPGDDLRRRLHHDLKISETPCHIFHWGMVLHESLSAANG